MEAVESKDKVSINEDDEPIVVTLPDGRHKTNLGKLIRTEQAKRHFEEIVQVVLAEKKEAEE